MEKIKLLLVSKYIIKILENSNPIYLEVFHNVDEEKVYIRDQKDNNILLTADLHGLEGTIPIKFEENSIQVFIIPKE